MASTISIPVVSEKTRQPGFGLWLSQGAAAGIFVGFLFPVVQMLTARNPYNFLLIPALPLFLFGGLLAGTFKSFVFWACTTILPRRLAVVCRLAITVVLLGFIIGIWWWQWFSAGPMRSVYYSGSSPSAVASLEGVRVIRLAVTVGAKPEDITEAQLRNWITYDLMDAGIDVIGINSRTDAQATLYVDYSIWSDLKQPEFYNSNCRLRLTQDVVLHRDPQIRTEAPTWEYQSGSLSAGGPKHSNITEAVEQFVRDYNRANSGAAAPESSSKEQSKLSQLIWNCAYLSVTAVVFVLVIGSNLNPWHRLVDGGSSHSTKPTILAVLTGTLLRVVVVFLSMESVLALICTLKSNSQRRDLYLAFFAVGHCVLGLIAVFGRFKFVTLGVLSLIAISPVLLLLQTLQQSIHWIVISIILGYITLWMWFLLTRSSLIHSVFSNLKQEFRYYLID